MVYEFKGHASTSRAGDSLGTRLVPVWEYTNCADRTYACMYDLQKALDTVECGVILKQNSMGRHGDSVVRTWYEGTQSYSRTVDLGIA